MYLDYRVTARIARILNMIDMSALLLDSGGNVLLPEGDQRTFTIPEEALGYYGYRIERTEQAITLYAASPNGSMEAFVYLAEAFVTGYEDGCYLIFEGKDFLPIGSTIEVRG